MMPSRPTVVFDGDCGFCRRWIARWRTRTGNRVDYATRQDLKQELGPELHARSARAVLLLAPDGTVREGAAAIFALLAEYGALPRPWKFYRCFPFLSSLLDAGYRHVAEHRDLYSQLERCWGDGADHRLTAWLLRRGIALIYLIAFLSLAGQIRGLIGGGGLLPARVFLEAVGNHYGAERYLILPTLFWFGSGDGALQTVCWLGAGFSILSLTGVLPLLSSIILWVLYLSLVSVGQDFLSFQWDALLLEAGFLGILLSPWNWFDGPVRAPVPSQTVLWLFRFFLFRFYLLCGLVKLLSGDRSWWGLTALNYHYFTQPLPNPTAWFAHQFPAWFQALSTVVMFGIELAVPLLIFCGRRCRLAAFPALAGLQIVILLTGNHAFFNWLTLVLCLCLLDDKALGRRPAARKNEKAFSAPLLDEPTLKSFLIAPVAILLCGLGCLTSLGRVVGGLDLFPPFTQVMEWNYRLRLVNAYGVFAVMTTERPEIVIEGSRDRTEWKEYVFRYKPGPLNRRPPVIAPFQPRLDWQMWFAALGAPQLPRWFEHLLAGLLQNNRDILGLLRENPFPGEPPRWIRVRLYQYRFTSPAERRETGNWWKRDLDSELIPPVGL